MDGNISKIREDHIKKVFAHQEQQELLLQMAERMFAIENRIAKLDEKTRERLEAFLEGAKRVTVRQDTLESKIYKVKEVIEVVHDKVSIAIALAEKAQQILEGKIHETQ